MTRPTAALWGSVRDWRFVGRVDPLSRGFRYLRVTFLETQQPPAPGRAPVVHEWRFRSAWTACAGDARWTAYDGATGAQLHACELRDVLPLTAFQHAVTRALRHTTDADLCDPSGAGKDRSGRPLAFPTVAELCALLSVHAAFDGGARAPVLSTPATLDRRRQC